MDKINKMERWLQLSAEEQASYIERGYIVYPDEFTRHAPARLSGFQLYMQQYKEPLAYHLSEAINRWMADAPLRKKWEEIAGGTTFPHSPLL
jgi:L-rhamnose mutarotase